MITETVYRDRDNTISVGLRIKGQSDPDITGTTRAIIQIGDKSIDSSTVSGVFDWDTNGSSGQLDLTLGHQGLPAGKFVSTITTFDTTYPNGFVWDELVIVVK